jgi:uncharacterized protein (DUF2236 family)
MTASIVDEEIPREIEDSIVGLGLLAGGANVVMQLSRLPVGHGVARSTVDSGRVDKHPVKRLRTTAAYLVIALFGTAQERLAMRREIDRVHARVRSEPSDPVAYNAFDPELQLWVAACLYKGLEDGFTVFHGGLDPTWVDDVLYPHGKRFATTLQVSEEMWPPDRAAFERYWQAGLEQIEMDDLTRQYLRTIADFSFVVAPLGVVGVPLARMLRPVGRFITLGFLPQPFREQLGLPWNDRRQRQFDRLMTTGAAISKRLPRPARQFPLNVYLWDTRRRIHTGRNVV